MNEDLYQEHILDHYHYPRHKGKIVNANVIHREINPLCGDELTFYASIDKEKIKALSFEGNGCAVSQASASLLSEFLQGKTIKDIKKLDDNTIYSLLGISISHTRRKCALLSMQAIKEGVRLQEQLTKQPAKNIKTKTRTIRKG